MSDSPGESSDRGARFPPGTVYLTQDTLPNEGTRLKLEPEPSNDPNEPLNWSPFRKWLNFTLVMAVTVAIFTALSIQILFWQLLVPDLGVSYQQLNNSVAINNVGLSFGCLFFIPLATKYGRRPVYVVSTGIMFLMSIWSAKMTSISELYLTNLFMGFAGATNEAIFGMTITDLFFLHQRGTMGSLYLVATSMGSFVTPVASGEQAETQGWRWCYWLLSIFTGLLFLIFVFFFEETKYVPVLRGTSVSNDATPICSPKDNEHVNKSNLVATRTVSRDAESPIPLKPWRARYPIITPTSESLWVLFYEPIKVLLTYPVVMYTALQYGSNVVWLTFLASIISTLYAYPPYNFGPLAIGLVGFAPFIGTIFGGIWAGPINDRYILRMARKNGNIYEPEMRLHLSWLPAIMLTAGLIMFGATTAKGLHWIWPSIGGGLYGFGLVGMSDPALALVMDSYRDMTGEAFVGVAFIRNALSIGAAFAITPMLNRMGVQNMFIVLGFLALAMSALTVPVLMFGKKWREGQAERYYARFSQ